MSQQSLRLIARMVSLLVVLIWTTSPISAQYGAKNGEWHFNGGDAGNTRYSPLDQINIGGESPESSGFRGNSQGARQEIAWQAGRERPGRSSHRGTEARYHSPQIAFPTHSGGRECEA